MLRKQFDTAMKKLLQEVIKVQIAQEETEEKILSALEEMNERLADKQSETDKKLSVLDDYLESDEETKKTEKKFLEGIANIMSFGGMK